jgi:drug/metabolite transporter (DMT)-like permease
MDGTTFAWTLAATLFAGIQLFFQKVVASQGRNAALNGALMYGLSGAAILFIIFFWYDVPESINAIALFGLLAGITHAIGNFVRIESLRFIDSVIFFPLNKVLGPIIVVIGGVWWFGDALSARESIGVILSICVPLVLISATEKHRQTDLTRGLLFLVISTVLTSVGILFTKQGLLFDPTLFYIMGMGQLFGMITSLAIFFRERHVRASKHFGITSADLWLGALAGILSFASFYSLLKAMSLGQLSLVYVIHAHYILVPIILSIWWYGEHINTRKVAAVVLSFLAISLLI